MAYSALNPSPSFPPGALSVPQASPFADLEDDMRLAEEFLIGVAIGMAASVALRVILNADPEE